jgi:hypothetical protein
LEGASAVASIRITPITLTLGLVGLIVAATAVAQPAQPSPPQGQNQHASERGWWNPDFMMDIYVKALTRQYNLDPRQEKFTRKLLAKHVKDYLEVHESEIRNLMWQMVEYQRERKLPPSEVVRQWAEVGTPLFRDAKREILEGNREWREILNETQKKRHDQDMKLLDRQLGDIEQRLDRWGDGKVSPQDFGPFGQRRRDGGELGGGIWERGKPEDAWEFYLRMFCARYRLTPPQRQTAESVLRKYKGQAEAYRRAKQTEFDAIEAKETALRASYTKGDADKDEIKKAIHELHQLNAKRRELEKHITDVIGKEFREKLMEIPTQEQKLAYEQRQERREETIKKRLQEREAKKDAEAAKSEEHKDEKAASTQPAEG